MEVVDFAADVLGPPDRKVTSAASRLPRSVLVLAVGVTVAIGAITVLRHHRFLSQAYDMGFYIHDIWRIAHGEWTSSVFGFHVFADHFSPIMILLAPVAWLGATGESLLLIQAMAIGLGVLAAYLLGEKLSGSRLGWLCAIWFALSASVWHTVMYDFRPANLGVIALLWLVVAMERGWRWPAVLAFALLAASAREDVAVLAGVAMAIHAVRRRERLRLLGGLAVGVTAIGIAYSMGGSRIFAPFDYFLWYQYADYGNSPVDALLNLDYLVPTALSRLVRPDPLLAFAGLLMPLLFVPALLGWKRSWPGLLIMLSNGVSAHATISPIYYQYYFAAVVFLIWGAAHVYRNEEWLKRRSLSMAATIGIWFALGPAIYVGYAPENRTVSGVIAADDRSDLRTLVDRVPSNASISAGGPILPQVAERDDVFPFPGPLRCGQSIVFYTPTTRYPDFVLAESAEIARSRLDLHALGYTRIDQLGAAELWRAEGPHPEPEPCPSPSEARDAQFEMVVKQAVKE